MSRARAAGPQRTRRPGLSRERIAAASVQLIDRVGLEAFGVRPLAAELGVDPMSIYNHVPGKAALLDAVSEAVLVEVAGGLEDLPDEWFDVARAIAHRYREMAMRHPHVFPLLTTRSQRSAAALQALEKLSAAMRRAGITDQIAADAPMILFGFLNGYLLAVVGADASGATLEERVVAAAAAVDPVSFPAMSALAELQADYGSRDHFDRMLNIVLAGLRAKQSGPQPS